MHVWERKEEKEKGSKNMRKYTGARQPDEGADETTLWGKNLRVFTQAPIHKSHEQRGHSRMTSFFATMPLILSTCTACPSIVRPANAALVCASPPPSPFLADTQALASPLPLCSSTPTPSRETLMHAAARDRREKKIMNKCVSRHILKVTGPSPLNRRAPKGRSRTPPAK
jgi:hypothetical protein